MFHVKHQALGQESASREALAELAAQQLSSLGVEVPPSALLACAEYLIQVLHANARVNLTAIRDPREAIRLHIVDSLAALPALDGAPLGNLCDVGSGAGFPGVPLCLASGRGGVLLDSVGRKVEAVASALAASSISIVSAVNDRAESFALVSPQAFAVVTARAVAELPVLVEYAAPLLVPGGVFLAMKGTPSAHEIARGLAAAEMCGLGLHERRSYKLPVLGEAREIISFKRIADPHVALPRRVGRPNKRPLA